MSDAPRLRLLSAQFFERPVRLRLPFRFGIVTLTEAPQVFVRARIRLADGREEDGVSAELMVPKWFDKNPALSNEDNFDQLREALFIARDLYTAESAPRTAFGCFAANYRSQIAEGARQALNPLVACYGPALLDRAILDALARLHGVSFYQAMQRNLAGVVIGNLTPDLAGFDIDRFLASLAPRETIAARHTVGLVDPITAADQSPSERVNDGLPETLEEVVAAYGHQWFKLKVGGDIEEDIDRLSAIAAVLDGLPRPYRSTLDGNEQYVEIDAVVALWRRICETPRLARLRESVVFIEQPINRKLALARDIRALSAVKPVIIDESDAELDAFPRARALGYVGVSSKSCKGVYKSILNAARIAKWNAEAGERAFLMSGEDLTAQAGLSVQQDLALVNLLGLAHVERNGHHYANGMAIAPPEEQAAFLAAHSDLYTRNHGAVRLTIAGGTLNVGSLDCSGFAAAAEPDWKAMQSMSRKSRHSKRKKIEPGGKSCFA